MIGVLGREKLDLAAVERSPVEVPEVWIASRFSPPGREVDGSPSGIDVNHLPYQPFPFGQTPLQTAGSRVVDVEMSPAVSFGKPQYFVRFRMRRRIARIDETLLWTDASPTALLQDLARLFVLGVNGPE